MMTVPRLQSASLAAPHGFFGRAGGVSEPPFDSLNASLASGDVSEAVEENRRRIAAALGAETLLTAKQVHGDTAILVDKPFAHDDRPTADALVTRTPGLALGALAADCVPVLFEAPGLVAAAHAGWRGSLAGIIGSTVALLKEEGAEASAIRAAIGPHLRGSSFEVRDDLIEDVLSRYPEAERFFTRVGGGQALYDHTGFVRARLLEAGLAPGQIGDVGGDTLAEPERFFSYRAALRAGQTRFGHNLSAIALPLDPAS